MMKLKRTYSITVDEDLAFQIEEYKDKHKTNYTDLFVRAIEQYLGLKK